MVDRRWAEGEAEHDSKQNRPRPERRGRHGHRAARDDERRRQGEDRGSADERGRERQRRHERCGQADDHAADGEPTGARHGVRRSAP